MSLPSPSAGFCPTSSALRRLSTVKSAIFACPRALSKKAWSPRLPNARGRRTNKRRLHSFRKQSFEGRSLPASPFLLAPESERVRFALRCLRLLVPAAGPEKDAVLKPPFLQRFDPVAQRIRA